MAYTEGESDWENVVDLPGVKLFVCLQPSQFLRDSLIMDHAERSADPLQIGIAEQCVGRRFKPFSIHVRLERFVYSSRSSFFATIFLVPTEDSENSEPRHEGHIWIGGWCAVRSQDIGNTIRFLVHD